MEIEKIKIEDVKQASDLIKRCLKEVNSKDYNKRIINNLCEYYSKKEIIKLSKEREFYVLKDNSKILGTACLYKKFISVIFVDPDHHKTGYGTMLMDKLESIVFDKDSPYLKTILYSSLTSVEFYKKRGYEILGDYINSEFGNNKIMQKTRLKLWD
jgi:histone acetyltransferase (RNA polymerase elongator complex component)